jgi:hypothetical protein
VIKKDADALAQDSVFKDLIRVTLFNHVASTSACLWIDVESWATLFGLKVAITLTRFSIESVNVIAGERSITIASALRFFNNRDNLALVINGDGNVGGTRFNCRTSLSSFAVASAALKKCKLRIAYWSNAHHLRSRFAGRRNIVVATRKSMSAVDKSQEEK